MLQSYEKWNICMAASACLAIAVLLTLMAFGCAVIVLAVYAVAVFAVFFGLDRLEKKRFPHWRMLRWKTPWAPVIALFVLFVVLDLILPDGRLGFITIWGVFSLACLVGPLQTTYFARKYHMDAFASVEELLASHPELKERIKS